MQVLALGGSAIWWQRTDRQQGGKRVNILSALWGQVRRRRIKQAEEEDGMEGEKDAEEDSWVKT